MKWGPDRYTDNQKDRERHMDGDTDIQYRARKNAAGSRYTARYTRYTDSQVDIHRQTERHRDRRR